LAPIVVDASWLLSFIRLRIKEQERERDGGLHANY
jgi:hypothetical protein